MNKNTGILQSIIVLIGLVFLGLSIVYAANILKVVDTIENTSVRYQIVQISESNVAVIDNQTNKIYYKYISPSQGPTDWEEMVLPK